jgi:hypothetical protein
MTHVHGPWAMAKPAQHQSSHGAHSLPLPRCTWSCLAIGVPVTLVNSRAIYAVGRLHGAPACLPEPQRVAGACQRQKEHSSSIARRRGSAGGSRAWRDAHDRPVEDEAAGRPPRLVEVRPCADASRRRDPRKLCLSSVGVWTTGAPRHPGRGDATKAAAARTFCFIVCLAVDATAACVTLFLPRPFFSPLDDFVAVPSRGPWR